MKPTLSPLYLAEGQQSASASSSKLDNPLAAFLGSLTLVFVVAVHFYALGAKSDPALLAFDESESWRLAASSTNQSLASASSVLFSKRDLSALQSEASGSTILSSKSDILPGSSRSFGLSASPANSAGLEATLLVLNFGP